MKITKPLAASLVFAVTTSAHAALFDRGNGLIYDSVLDITWLQDANYVVASGYAAEHGTTMLYGADNVSTGGRMGWDAAHTWVDQLVYAGHDDWRLPSIRNAKGGYNNTQSEIGYMFYVNLGNSGYTCSRCLDNVSFIDATTNTLRSFLNLQEYVYWYAEAKNDQYVWATHLAFGNLDSNYDRSWNNYAWAVHDGDIANVPAPAGLWLLASGLFALAGIARKGRRR